MTVTEDARIDVREPLRDLCARLGLKYELVHEMVMEPHRIIVTMCKLDEQGAKFLLDGEVATDQLEYRIRT